VQKTLDALYSSPRDIKIDNLQVNVYEPFGSVRQSSEQTKGGAAGGSGDIKWWEQLRDRDLFKNFLLAYNDFNDRKLPMYLNEMGIMYKQEISGEAEPREDGWNRQKYLTEYMGAMLECMNEGIDIKQFLYWSIVDDYE
jgi:hypothetical protein